MDRRVQAASALAESVARIDALLNPWRFTFAPDGVRPSHTGPYASGHYRRGLTSIGLSCRKAIDNIFYEHSFVTTSDFSEEIERFTIGHDTLMRALGHSEDCWLLACDGTPYTIDGRDGVDRVEAFMHDLLLAAPVLRERNDDFCRIVRRGCRSYSVAARKGC
jgi:hypothetical protein